MMDRADNQSFPAPYLRWAQALRVPLGFVAVLLFLLLMDPKPSLVVTGSIIAFIGILVRFWSAGYLCKGSTLTTAGPYRFTRNPLYLGSLIMLIGLSITGGSWLAGAVFLILFALIYIPTMLCEESELRRGFQETFDNYARAVPRFFPRWTHYPSSRQSFSIGQAFRNREYSAFLGYLLVLLFICVKLRLQQ